MSALVSLAQTSTSVAIAVGVCALLGAVVAHVRWVRPKWRNFKVKATGAIDSIVGRDAIIDSITGREIEPALPGAGVRLENVERLVERMAAVMESQHDQDQIIASHDHRIALAEDAIKQLQEAAVERVFTRAESAAAWRAMEALANTDTPPDESAELD